MKLELTVRSLLPSDAESDLGRLIPEGIAAQNAVIAEQGGRVIGVMAISEHGECVVAEVTQKHREQGIGTAMMAVLEGRARAADLSVLTAKPPHAARHFFAKQGWLVRHEAAGSTLLMDKPLFDAEQAVA